MTDIFKQWIVYNPGSKLIVSIYDNEEKADQVAKSLAECRPRNHYEVFEKVRYFKAKPVEVENKSIKVKKSVEAA